VPQNDGELVRRWNDAERRLYPVVLTNPEAFERYVLAARRLADELSAVGTFEALAEAYASAGEQAVAELRRLGPEPDAGAVELVAGAAFALRNRELASELATRQTAERLRQAADQGPAWVVLQETGSAASPLPGQYRRLEVHVPDGVGLSSSVEWEIDADRPLYVVERMDEEGEERWEFGDPGAWTEAIEELRRRPAGS
jgi:hypothetical protein